MLNPSGTNAGAYVESISFHATGVGPNPLESQTLHATTKAGTRTIETRYKTPRMGCNDPTRKVVCRDRSQVCTGKTIPPAFAKAAKTSRKIKAATSKRLKNLFRRFLLRSILTSWLPGKEASSETFSCGQPCTQSNHRLQAIPPFFPTRHPFNPPPPHSSPPPHPS